jgi:Eco57I restriction-modification methylase
MDRIKEFGEVFTPISLVKELLNKLPIDVWTNPSLTWFEPSAGRGVFMNEVFSRLNKYHHKDHILINMLFMAELQHDNCEILRKTYINIYEGNTLTMLLPHKFDIIVGNPPFNSGGIRSATGLRLGEKNETIWPKFVKKVFDEWLKQDGYLVFITPLSWLKKSHSLHTDIVEKHFVWLKLWDALQSKKMINAGIAISLYALQNTLNTQNKKTEIVSEIKHKLISSTSFKYLNPKYSIPLANHNIFDKLGKFINKHNCKLEFHIKAIKSTGEQHPLPSNYVLEDNWAIDTYRKKDGLFVKRAIQQHPDANKRKLIIANKTNFTGAFIDEGKLSLTGNHKFYILGDNLELIKKILGFSVLNLIIDSIRYHMSFLDETVFDYIPDIRKMGINDITEDEFINLLFN